MVSVGVFWAALATLAYTYVVFPLLVLLRALVWPRPHVVADVMPSVSVVIAAHNEAATIGHKTSNLLALDYDRSRLEVIVASDGSTDGTEEVVQGYADQGVRLLALPRRGKAAALNAAVDAARGDVVVFSDANSMYAPNALRALVRPFADPAVGGVAGNQCYLPANALHPGAAGEQRYWSFDRLLKRAESRAGNTISATGAIYAVRRELVGPVPDGVTDDFFMSTGVIVQGRRLVFAPDAVAYEPIAASTGAELGRKVRVVTRGLRAVMERRELLDPSRYGFYALQLLSHKVLRRLMAVPLLMIALVSPGLWRRAGGYRAVVVGQVLFYGAAGLGLRSTDSSGGWRRLLTMPAYLCLVNAACLQALWNLARGNRIDRWEPQRDAAAPVQPWLTGDAGRGT
jgi:GT2 family glycosyltransferase